MIVPFLNIWIGWWRLVKKKNCNPEGLWLTCICCHLVSDLPTFIFFRAKADKFLENARLDCLKVWRLRRCQSVVILFFFVYLDLFFAAMPVSRYYFNNGTSPAWSRKIPCFEEQDSFFFFLTFFCIGIFFLILKFIKPNNSCQKWWKSAA